MRLSFFSALLCAAWLSPLARAEEKPTRPIDFLRDVRPILADKCFACHGPDDKARKGKLRLDVRAEALKGGRSGKAAFVSGKPENSELIGRLTTEDDSEKMPPPKSGKKLTAAQVQVLRKWVSEGAPYQGHWAYSSPSRPALPAIKDLGRVRNPIDVFILASLEKEKVSPSPEAARETLLRRLHLDLTGLPPTPDLIDAFLGDTSPSAYERAVDRLLASPAYGERWGRHWLDAARYADSDGYEKDKPRSVWMYRDWVVAALNRDLPYDKFILEQVAGDLLPGAGQDQRVATGFLRNSMINEEGGIDPEQFRMEAMFDRMDAVGKAVLGLGLGCAQCHNHKFDPITQEDYYKVFACLNDTHEASIPAYTPAEERKRTEVLRKIRAAEQELRHNTPDWAKKMAAWEEKARKEVIPWLVVKVQNAGDGSQRYVYHEDGSQTAGGYAPTKWTSRFSGKIEASAVKKITGFRLEMLTDPNLPLGGPGRSPTGLFGLSEFRVDVADPRKPTETKRIKLVAASADFGNEERPLAKMYDDRSGKPRVTGPVSYAIDGKSETAWGIDAGPGRRNVDRKAVFVPETPIDVSGGAILTFHLEQMHGGWNSDDNQNNNLGRFRFSVTDSEKPTADPVPKRVREILAIAAEARTSAQAGEVFSYWRTRVPEWKEANRQIEELWKQHPAGSAQLTLAAREKTRPTFLLDRGDFLRPKERVLPGVVSSLHPLPEGVKPGRLELAKWLVDPKSPTTARAIVNRVWQAYFGTGLVSTSEDLGFQSEFPSHPELLDWLAVEFMERGWSLKQLHRLIVTSATYRQSSRVTVEQAAKDPGNRLLSRGPRFRVEAEVVRDVALAAGGLLTEQVGGPPAHPPAPAFLFVPPASYGPKVWSEATGAERYRRAIYTFRFRSVPYPVLTTFDAPNGDAACVRRTRSNTPLQALTTLNEPLFLECARGLGLVTLREGGNSDTERVKYAFRRCTGRKPTPAEQEVLQSFLSRQMERFSAPGARPWDLAASDPANPPILPAGVTPAQAASWTSLARLLLNLDETITKE